MASVNHQQLKGQSMTNRQSAESPTKVKAVFTICNDKGLHTRPATELVRCTARFRAQANLTYKSVTVNAKSLLGILMLAAGKGAKITIEAEGADAHQLVEAVTALAQSGFNIRY
jgi:phosphocarrier protein HPr